MREIIINDFDLKEEEIDKTLYKARGILLDNDNILVAKYNDAYLLPGGKLDKGESEDEALIRELEEETGIIYNINDFNKLFKVIHYQRDYVGSSNKKMNRKVITYYYIGSCKGIDKSNIKMSKKEKMGNFSTGFIKIKELKKLLSTDILMNRASYYDRELSIIITEMSKEG